MDELHPIPLCHFSVRPYVLECVTRNFLSLNWLIHRKAKKSVLMSRSLKHVSIYMSRPQKQLNKVQNGFKRSSKCLKLNDKIEKKKWHTQNTGVYEKNPKINFLVRLDLKTGQ